MNVVIPMELENGLRMGNKELKKEYLGEKFGLLMPPPYMAGMYQYFILLWIRFLNSQGFINKNGTELCEVEDYINMYADHIAGKAGHIFPSPEAYWEEYTRKFDGIKSIN